MSEGQKTYGVCAVRGYRADKAGMTRHLAKQPHAQDGAAGQPVLLYPPARGRANGLYCWTLRPGRTRASVTSISFSGESGWSAVAI